MTDKQEERHDRAQNLLVAWCGFFFLVLLILKLGGEIENLRAVGTALFAVLIALGAYAALTDPRR